MESLKVVTLIMAEKTPISFAHSWSVNQMTNMTDTTDLYKITLFIALCFSKLTLQQQAWYNTGQWLYYSGSVSAKNWYLIICPTRMLHNFPRNPEGPSKSKVRSQDGRRWALLQQVYLPNLYAFQLDLSGFVVMEVGTPSPPHPNYIYDIPPPPCSVVRQI